jgi:hypothetical protein
MTFSRPFGTGPHRMGNATLKGWAILSHPSGMEIIFSGHWERALFQQAAIWTPAASFGNWPSSGYGWAGDGAFAEGFAAAGAEEFVKLTGWQHEQKAFAHRLSGLAFRTVEFAGGEAPELL